MTKSEQYLQLMLKEHEVLFNDFRIVHDQYVKDPKKFQREFDNVGRDVQDIIRRYENLLCNSTESSQYNKYSAKLAEKFHDDIKTIFPKIDFIGMEIN